MLQHDSMFFIGVFVFIFLLWLVLGGPARPLSFTGPLLSGPGALGGGTYITLPQVRNFGSSNVGQSQASGRGDTILPSNQNAPLSSKDQKAVAQAIKDAAFGTPSPARGTVTLSRQVSNAGAANAQTEYVQVSLASNASAPITLSGWSLTSEVSGKGATIPQGTEVPRSGIVNASEPIVLRPGDRAIISSGRSPIGASFRENICIAYFGQFQKFSPTLPNSCPTPKTELEQRYGPDLVRDPACSEYVSKLSRCTLAVSPPPTLSSSCQSFLTNYLNYNGCLATHERDYNFKGTTWRVYLGRDTSIWRTTREVVKLLDASGKTVDMFTY